jgi:hypothetical protein
LVVAVSSDIPERSLLDPATLVTMVSTVVAPAVT